MMRNHCEAATTEFGKAKWHGRLLEPLVTRAISLNIFGTLIFATVAEFGVIVMTFTFILASFGNSTGGDCDPISAVS